MKKRKVTHRKTKERRSKIELPEQLRAWRKRYKLSQSTAAIKLRMSKRTLQEWEQARAEPRGLALEGLRAKIGQ